MKRWLVRLQERWNRKRAEHEMADEMQFHLEERAREHLAEGLSQEEAHRAARRKFGGMEQMKEIARAQRRGRWLEDFARDVAYGMRALRRNPGFTMAAMLTLALGIGANAAVFSLMHRMLFAHLPVQAPEQLVALERSNATQRGLTIFPYAFFQQLESEKEIFAGVLARSRGVELVTVGAAAGGEPARGELVAGNYFTVLGVQPRLGRLFTAADDTTPGAHPVVVLSYRYWQRSFGGDPRIVGQTIRLTGHAMTVVGVLPARFAGLDPSEEIDLRVPLAMQAELRGGRSNPAQRSGTDVQLVARLQPGVSLAQAEALAAARWRQYLDATAPASAQDRQLRESERIEVRPAAAGYGQARQKFQPALRVLIAITAALLVVACLNLASLLLARAAARRHEFALRLALGAGPGRLVRQLLAEGLLIALSGAGLGALLALPATQLLGRVLAVDGAATDLPAIPSGAVLLGLAGTAVACGAIFGLAPAWQVRRQALAAGLKGDARSGTAMRGRKLLVAAQVAACVVVLTGAGLFVRTVYALQSTSPGFDTGQLLLAALSPKNAGRTDAEAQAFFREVRERVGALPGVTGVTYSMIRALAGNSFPAAIVAEGASAVENAPPPVRNVVGPDYFHTFGIPLIAGRDFATSDDGAAPKVAIVSLRLAQLYFPGQDPIGRRIGIGRAEHTIVGVARDVRHAHVREEAAPQWYIPYEQFPAAKYLDLCVRTTGEPEAMLPAVRAAIADVDRGVALFEVRTQEAQLDQLLATERALAKLATFFGAIAVALAAVGLYGLLAYLVTQQRREIGIRLALGAQPDRVLRAILRRGLRLTFAGILVGVPLALMASRSVASLLFGVSPADPATLIVVAGLLAGVAVLACWWPARRAARTDPMLALRVE